MAEKRLDNMSPASQNPQANPAEMKLAETRQRVRDLAVLGLDWGLSPRQRALARDLELATRAEVKLRQKALAYLRRGH